MANIVKAQPRAPKKNQSMEIELPDTGALLMELPPDVQSLLGAMENKQVSASVRRSEMIKRINQIDAVLAGMPEVVAMMEERDRLRKSVKQLEGIVNKSGDFIAEALSISFKDVQGKTLVEKSKTVRARKELKA